MTHYRLLHIIIKQKISKSLSIEKARHDKKEVSNHGRAIRVKINVSNTILQIPI